MTSTTVRDHPVYAAAIRAADPRERYGSPSYSIRLADTARLVRDACARRWPDVRFYVRSKSYAGGASITVSYDGRTRDELGRDMFRAVDYDGAPIAGIAPVPESALDYRSVGPRWAPVPRDGAPTVAEVTALVHVYGSRGFDGMTDCSYGIGAWLAPDGSATFAYATGTGAMPAEYGSIRHPSAILASFGASYVFVQDSAPFDIRERERAAGTRARPAGAY